MIELYAIADAGGPPLPPIAGLREVTSGRLAALCAPATDEPLSAELLWRHEAVVEALMHDRDLLPARYGARLRDEAAVEATLSERHDELARRLDLVRGCAEVSLRAVGELPVRQPARTGADYMHAKRDSAGAAGRLHEPLVRLARASTTRPAGAGPELLRAAYLVDRGVLDAFTARVAELQQANPQLQLLCTGPWPPYSFSDG